MEMLKIHLYIVKQQCKKGNKYVLFYKIHLLFGKFYNNIVNKHLYFSIYNIKNLISCFVSYNMSFDKQLFEQYISKAHQSKDDSPSAGLFAHWFSLGDARTPSTKWQNTLKDLVDLLTIEQLLPIYTFLGEHFVENEEWLLGKRQAIVKGWLYTAPLLAEYQEIYPMVEKVIQKCYLRLPVMGVLAEPLGKLGLKVLANIGNIHAAQILIRLSQGAKRANTLTRAAQKAFEILAKQSGRSEDDWRELVLPNYGVSNRVYEQNIGDYVAQVFISDYHTLITEWKNAEGKVQKSEPATIKRDYLDELAQFKAHIANIKKALSAERANLEHTWRTRRVWHYDHFTEHYLHHPIRQILVEGLIFQCHYRDSIQHLLWQEGHWRTAAGDVVIDADFDAINLWHPVMSTVEEVLAWRNYLMRVQLRQPFKQAFREVYVITEAEVRTAVYSNRFSAHILRQRQLLALANQRDWQYRGNWGYGDEMPVLHLPAYGLAVSLDVVFIGEEYVSTQRVVFRDDSAARQSLVLGQVPAVAFSEAMRDIDLFVAVCSIGNDPNWTGGDEYRNYWEEYAFGAKSETTSARARREVLESIVPRLKISKQCHFEGNFLVVQGSLRSYKINIGSGNILMKPNDQYLCIVPDARARAPQGVFLPFEGDSTLTLILSKAFLLADDAHITDRTILSQIHS